MKTGIDYRLSREQRRFDVAFARALAVPELMVRMVAKHTFLKGLDDTYYYQNRTGQDGREFIVIKQQTLNEDGVALSGLADIFRMNGLDELSQRRNILAGQMAAVGRRPLMPDQEVAQYEAAGHDAQGARIVDRHRRLVRPTLPGCISTYALFAHTGEIDVNEDGTSALRLETEIEDVVNASLAYDLRLIGQACRNVALGSMQVGSTTPREIKPNIE